MIWQKRAESEQQRGRSSRGDRKDAERGGIGVVPPRPKSEIRAYSESPAAESTGTTATAGPVKSGGAEEVLNSATRQQLLSVYGIGPVLADRIIQNRPYKAAYEVVEKGIIPESIFVQLRKQLLQQHEA
jgi:DNA uptake protein ComE-like DNA-binding protein